MIRRAFVWDPTNTVGRRDAVIQALAEADWDVVAPDGKPAVDPEGCFSLLLVHVTDQRIWNPKGKVDVIQPGVIVSHTYGSSREPSVLVAAGLTKISCSSTYIIENLSAFLSSWAATGTPDVQVLLTSRTAERLQALAVLAQGYLAVCALRGHVKVEDSSEAAAALKTMGWEEAQAAIHESVAETDAWNDIGERSWWLTPFVGEITENHDRNSDAMKAFAGELEAEMTREKASGDGLEGLKKWLLGEVDTLDASSVGKAYSDLAQVLGAKVKS